MLCHHTLLFSYIYIVFCLLNRCGNVAAILELDEHLRREFTIFEAAPQVGIVQICTLSSTVLFTMLGELPMYEYGSLFLIQP